LLLHRQLKIEIRDFKSVVPGRRGGQITTASMCINFHNSPICLFHCTPVRLERSGGFGRSELRAIQRIV